MSNFYSRIAWTTPSVGGIVWVVTTVTVINCNVKEINWLLAWLYWFSDTNCNVTIMFFFNCTKLILGKCIKNNTYKM